MTDTPTPPAMTPEQRAELVNHTFYAGAVYAAEQLEADGVTIATLTAERDAAQAEIARLTAANATAREDGMREAATRVVTMDQLERWMAYTTEHGGAAKCLKEMRALAGDADKGGGV